MRGAADNSGLLKEMLKPAVPAIFALIAAGSAGAHEDDGIASDCLEVVAEGERWQIRNGCDVKVHIAWCEEEDGGYCSWKGGPNLEPGGTHSTGLVSDVALGSALNTRVSQWGGVARNPTAAGASHWRIPHTALCPDRRNGV